MREEIRIFVSNRTDINSVHINNNIYVPVRCGAIFDHTHSVISGDDSGDNKSRLKNAWSEFTVQYWAWKNHMSEWVGLCHYRRFLAFKSLEGKRNDFNMLQELLLTQGNAKKYGLTDEAIIAETVKAYDAVVSEYAPVEKVNSPKGHVHTVRELWEAHINIFIDKNTIPIMLKYIDELSPEYSSSAREYLSGNLHRGFNCYVLRRELFDRMCRFQFPIIEAMTEEYKALNYSGNMQRIPAYAGEMLYGIFVYHISTYEKWKIKTLPIVYFEMTEKMTGRVMAAKRIARFYIKELFRVISLPFFPRGSKAREKIKEYLKKKKII